MEAGRRGRKALAGQLARRDLLGRAHRVRRVALGRRALAGEHKALRGRREPLGHKGRKAGRVPKACRERARREHRERRGGKAARERRESALRASRVGKAIRGTRGLLEPLVLKDRKAAKGHLVPRESPESAV